MEMVGDKNFIIIDRIKNFFKLSQVNKYSLPLIYCIHMYVHTYVVLEKLDLSIVKYVLQYLKAIVCDLIDNVFNMLKSWHPMVVVAVEEV